MHDPKTVAFDLHLPFFRRGRYRHKIQLATIWHVDPQNFTFPDGTQKLGCRSDDSCGWFTPPHHAAEWETIKQLAISQYATIFSRHVAVVKGERYADALNAPETVYEIVYWIWRSIKAAGKKGWMYGRRPGFLSAGELEQIMILSTNPVDNVRHHAQSIKDEEGFIDLFGVVWNNYRRFHRPWYRHPRWHVNHWQIQFHPFQDLKRRYWDKCSVCGKRGFKGSAISDDNGTRIWHAECDGQQAKTGCGQAYLTPNQ